MILCELFFFKSAYTVVRIVFQVKIFTDVTFYLPLFLNNPKPDWVENSDFLNDLWSSFSMQINQWNGRIHVNLLHRKWSYSTGLISFGSINGKKKIRVDLTFTPIFITTQAITKALSFLISKFFFLFLLFYSIFFLLYFWTLNCYSFEIFYHSCSFSVRPCFRHACNHNFLRLDWHTPRCFIAR